MREGPEHRIGWRLRLNVDGETVIVEADHHTRRRNPRGHEIVNQMVRGRVWHQVDELDHAWAVIHGGRRVCTLRQAPSGDFHIGALRTFSRLHIEQAAAAAFRFMRPKPPEPPAESNPGTEDGPSGMRL